MRHIFVNYIDITERSPMDQSPPHHPYAVYATSFSILLCISSKWPISSVQAHVVSDNLC